MFIDLYLMQTYFEERCGAMYEADLIARYGQPAVHSAIDSGLLEHRYVPCGRGPRRCVCRLSEKGMDYARNLMGLPVGDRKPYEFRAVF